MQARSAEELFELAKGYDRPISMEEAEKIYAELNKEGELADEELEDVAGGGCSGPGLIKVSINSHDRKCPRCGSSSMDLYDGPRPMGDWEYYFCNNCKRKYRHVWQGDEWYEDPIGYIYCS